MRPASATHTVWGVLSSLFWGVLQGWSIASPWSGQPLWWLQLLSMAWLVRQLARASTPRASIDSVLPFTVAWFSSSLWWLYTSMHDYGGLAAPLAILAVLALCTFLSCFYVGACAAFVKLKSHRALLGATSFAALWLLAELVRGTVLSGFPWSAIGYAHIEGPFSGLAPWVGVYGISFAAAWLTALFVLTRSCALKIALLVLLLLRAYQFGHEDTLPTTQSTSTLTIRLLQGNIAQNEKFDATTGVDLALGWYQTQLLQAITDGVDLVVAPETAIPVLPSELPSGYWNTLQSAFAAQTRTAGLIGIPIGSLSGGFTNSVLGLQGKVNAGSQEALAYRYDKHHLVPFGEYIPPLFRWFTNLMHIPLGDFAQGAVAQPSMVHAGSLFAPNICYEDLFGEELAARFRDPKTAPGVLVNLSNMGWFAKPNQNSVAIDQHLNISRMRALEFDRPVIRATNTGATAIVNRHGVVTHSLPRASRAALTGTVSIEPLRLTPYTQWVSQLWLWPLYGLCFCVMALAFYLKKRD